MNAPWETVVEDHRGLSFTSSMLAKGDGRHRDLGGGYVPNRLPDSDSDSTLLA